MKIIFSDLDGTLLHRGEAEINKNIKKSIYKILDSGNMFCISSGRTYIELKHLLKEFEDDIFFVANDGSLSVVKEHTILSRPLDKKIFSNFKEFTAHGKYVTYVRSSNRLTIRNVMKQYRNHVMMIDDISEISEDIYKISDFDRSLFCPLPVVYRNSTMNEYIAKDTDKAEAIKSIVDALGIKKCDTYAFGDNTNDLCMFEFCGTSFAAAGAKPAIKKCADRVSYNIEKDFIEIIGG